jgi:hypothetical protein
MLTTMAIRQVEFLEKALLLAGISAHVLLEDVRDHDHLKHVLVKTATAETRLISLDEMMGFIYALTMVSEERGN